VNTLRGLLVDNLGLKLVALLLGVLVYLHAYTDRPASMIVTFRVQVTDLPDSLTLTGAAPATVQAELRGTGKQLIRLRVTEPSVKVSLAGVGVGRYERALTAADLPLPGGVELAVDRMLSPRTLELQVDRRATRTIAVRPRVGDAPAADAMLSGAPSVNPATVEVTGPAEVLATLDSLPLMAVSIAGRRDTVTALVAPELPEWCRSEPARVEVTIPLSPAITRRVALPVHAPDDETREVAEPAQVTAVVVGPRAVVSHLDLQQFELRWAAPRAGGRVGQRVPVRVVGVLPQGVRVRLEPDSVRLVAAAR
jgi:YbbR domain-containing protein